MSAKILAGLVESTGAKLWTESSPPEGRATDRRTVLPSPRPAASYTRCMRVSRARGSTAREGGDIPHCLLDGCVHALTRMTTDSSMGATPSASGPSQAGSLALSEPPSSSCTWKGRQDGRSLKKGRGTKQGAEGAEGQRDRGGRGAGQLSGCAPLPLYLTGLHWAKPGCTHRELRASSLCSASASAKRPMPGADTTRPPPPEPMLSRSHLKKKATIIGASGAAAAYLRDHQGNHHVLHLPDPKGVDPGVARVPLEAAVPAKVVVAAVPVHLPCGHGGGAASGGRPRLLCNPAGPMQAHTDWINKNGQPARAAYSGRGRELPGRLPVGLGREGDAPFASLCLKL